MIIWCGKQRSTLSSLPLQLGDSGIGPTLPFQIPGPAKPKPSTCSVDAGAEAEAEAEAEALPLWVCKTTPL